MEAYKLTYSLCVRLCVCVCLCVRSLGLILSPIIRRNKKTFFFISGHSLESDLLQLKLIHNTVVDTSVVFPHKMGLPFKRGRQTSGTFFFNLWQFLVNYVFMQSLAHILSLPLHFQPYGISCKNIFRRLFNRTTADTTPPRMPAAASNSCSGRSRPTSNDRGMTWEQRCFRNRCVS